MPSRFIADWNQYEATTLDPFDFPFRNTEFRRIDFIVGGIDSQQEGSDLFEIGCRVVIARGFILVQQVIGIGPTDADRARGSKALSLYLPHFFFSASALTGPEVAVCGTDSQPPPRAL